MDFREQDRSTATTHASRARSASPGAYETGTPESGHQRASDPSDNTESGSEVEQRQHNLKAITQAELLAQAKRRSGAADAGISDHDVRTAGKSTFTVTMSNQGNVERVPSKASLEEDHARRGYEDRRGRSAEVYVGRSRQQPVVEGHRDGSISLEWGEPAEPRSNMRAREHHSPARSRSYTSSEISSSIDSSVEHDDRQVGSRGRRRGRSHSSGDATPTEADGAAPASTAAYRKSAPTSREPIRRRSSLPTSDDPDISGDRRRGYRAAPVVESRQQNSAAYAGRSKAPVSGRQKIRRTTPDPEDEAEPRSGYAEPRSGYVYEDDVDEREVYVRSGRQRQAQSGRMPMNHDGVTSSSADDTDVVDSGRLYADRRTPTTNDEEGYGDAEVHRHRRAPAGRTGRIQRSADPVPTSSPHSGRRLGTPTSMDDRKYRQNPRVDVRHTRRAPSGRTKGIRHHGSTGNLDVNIVDDDDIGHKLAADGQRTPSSADWLRHQRSGRLTVDVVGHTGDSSSLHRAYRSMPDLMDDDGYTDEIVTTTSRERNYSRYVDDDDDARPSSSNPGGRVTATIRETVAEPRGDDVRYRQRAFSSGTERQASVVGRKRGVITGATVESRGGGGGGGRGRSGRTGDMPSSDVEDFSDAGWRKPSHVARIYVGGDDDDVSWESQDDTMSVFSEPPQRGRSRALLSQPVLSQPRPSALLTPTYRASPVPMSVPQGAFELAHVDTQIQTQLSPDVSSPESATISAVDPALRGARKQGTNYHIMLTLRPTITTTAAGSPSRSNAAVTSRPRQMTSPVDALRAVSSLAVYPTDDPDRTATLPSPRRPPASPPPRPGRGGTLATLPAAPRRRSRSRSAGRPPSDGQIAFDVEVRDDDPVVQTAASSRQISTGEYAPAHMGSVEFTYSPAHGDHEPPRRHRPAAPRYSDDEVPRSHRGRSHQPPPPPPPETRRRNFLVVNSVDATKPHKVLLVLFILSYLFYLYISGKGRKPLICR